jgi:hypothetical protein
MSKEIKKKNPLLGEESNEETGAEIAPATPAEKPKLNADDALLSDIELTKKILDKEEKVHFMIPLTEGEKPGAVHECAINGAKYIVKKGIMTMVPQSIANLLAEHYKVGMEAGASFRLDMNAEKQDRLA